MWGNILAHDASCLCLYLMNLEWFSWCRYIFPSVSKFCPLRTYILTFSTTYLHVIDYTAHIPILFTELKLMEKQKASFTIPWFGVIFGYILCGVCIANGVWWPYLYSLQWGKEISNKWLTSLVLSLFQSILVIQPVKV